MSKSGMNPVKMDEVLNFIKEYIGNNGFAPTVREVADGVGFKSPASAASYLSALESNGFIRRRPDSPRTIEVVGLDTTNGYEAVQIPVIKNVAVDMPLFAKPNIANYVSLPAELICTEGSLFAIKVEDDSMSDIGITSGSLVFVAGQVDIDDGDCVLCLVDGELLIRYIYMERETVRLVPASDAFEEEIVTYCQVVGKIVSFYNILKG